MKVQIEEQKMKESKQMEEKLKETFESERNSLMQNLKR